MQPGGQRQKISDLDVGSDECGLVPVGAPSGREPRSLHSLSLVVSGQWSVSRYTVVTR